MTPPGVQLRRLVPADAAAHRALMLEAYAMEPTAFTSSVAEREPLPLHWWAARLSDLPGAHERVIGAHLDGLLVGAAGLSFEQRERTRHKATLFGMYVRPAARGRGIARALVQEVLRQAQAEPGTALVQLTVTDTNLAALRLYTGCGFVPFGSEPCAVRFGSAYLTKLHLWRRYDVPMPMHTPMYTPDHFNGLGSQHLPGHLGIVITQVDGAQLRSELAVRPVLMAPNGFLHAGSVVTLADTSAGYGCLANLPAGATGFTTLELKSNHLGTAREGTLECVATAAHLGRTTQVWDAVVTHRETGKTVALFRCTQMILYARPGT